MVRRVLGERLFVLYFEISDVARVVASTSVANMSKSAGKSRAFGAAPLLSAFTAIFAAIVWYVLLPSTPALRAACSDTAAESRSGRCVAGAYITRGLCRTNAKASCGVCKPPTTATTPTAKPKSTKTPTATKPTAAAKPTPKPKPAKAAPARSRHRPIRRAPTSIHRARRGPPPANAQRTRASCFRAVRSRAARATAARAARGM